MELVTPVLSLFEIPPGAIVHDAPTSDGPRRLMLQPRERAGAIIEHTTAKSFSSASFYHPARQTVFGVLSDYHS